MSVALASLLAHMGQAFVAVEDQRFYQHDGVDVVGIAGAIRDNILGERHGASTITQQLVGNMHPDIIDRGGAYRSAARRRSGIARAAARGLHRVLLAEHRRDSSQRNCERISPASDSTGVRR